MIFYSYQNAAIKDCIEAALGNGVGLIRGRAVPDEAVQRLYRPPFKPRQPGTLVGRWFWSRIVAGWTGLRMWEFLLKGLDGWRPHTFGRLARTEKELMEGIRRYTAITVGFPSHQLCLARNEAGQVVYGMVEDEGPTAKEVVVDWPAFLPLLDPAVCYAYTPKWFDWWLLGRTLKNNWTWWVWGALALAFIALKVAPYL